MKRKMLKKFVLTDLGNGLSTKVRVRKITLLFFNQKSDSFFKFDVVK